LPLFGTLLKFLLNKDNRRNPLQLLSKFHEKYGKTFKFPPVFLRDNYSVITTDPDILHHVFIQNFGTVYQKGEFFQAAAKELFGNGIFGANGEQWKFQRNLALPLFNINKMKDYVGTNFAKHGNHIYRRLLELSQDGPIDMQDMYMRYTMTTFGEIGFGCDVGCIAEKENPFSKSFDYLQSQVTWRLRFGNLWKILPEPGLKAHIDYVTKYTMNLIAEKKKVPFEELTQNNDILSKAMCLKKPNGEPELNDEQLKDVVFNFLVAGRDTTAVLLVFTTYLLSLNPRVEQKVLEEIDRVVGDKPITFENMKDLHYLQNVFQETLRLYPSVPSDGYEAIKDDILPGGYFIPKGSSVGYSAYVIGRSPEFFPDPLSYKPERWDEKIPALSFVAFHIGPRVCLGQSLAYLEAKVLMTILLPKLKFELLPNFVMKEKRGVILTSSEGLPMIVKPRK